jgi:3',5'-cyclic AMP phosphodiesterase CpdA
MNEIQSLEATDYASRELLYFWVLGDLHYRANEQWHAIHARRMNPMFQDINSLWLDEGFPAFCTAPGDIVDTGAPENYKLAKMDLRAQLGKVPLYPGIGNHEYHPENKEDATHTAAEFSQVWEKPVRYSWIAGDVTCIMLDQPDPYKPGERREDPHVIFSPEALTFLDTALEENPQHPAIIFAHCPLRDTVLDRDPECNLDNDSQDPFFFVENSQDVREILARHNNAKLYISGHTHSGWGSPQLVFTETLDEHSITHLNVMSPWYTGRHRGIRHSSDHTTLAYYPDDPDMLVSFALHIYRQQAVIRVRDHRTRQWLTQWVIPFE